jgi:hypothetical protein
MHTLIETAVRQARGEAHRLAVALGRPDAGDRIDELRALHIAANNSFARALDLVDPATCDEACAAFQKLRDDADTLRAAKVAESVAARSK